MGLAETAWEIFNRSVADYHIKDDIHAEEDNPYKGLEQILYRKNWIDSVQWHLEDLIRDVNIEPVEALAIKRQIDALNQKRTDLVEKIDDYFLDRFSSVKVLPNARINTETPAWALDRLSILSLKIYHMKQETLRTGAAATHINQCRQKLSVLEEQQADLCKAINELLNDMERGTVMMKVYRQMKMYNDENLNPVLYQNKP
ncbi:MAG: DUF4254 domain-containing protein [Chryseobacterium sp.]|nr:MAG: DUF4254 domain-containing protein [Chryseobacterium sp.]